MPEHAHLQHAECDREALGLIHAAPAHIGPPRPAEAVESVAVLGRLPASAMAALALGRGIGRAGRRL